MNKNQSNHPALIVRLPNWVGDVIMALPALQVMQQSGIELHLLGKPWIADLLAATNLPLHALTNNFWQSTKIMANISNTNKSLLLTNSLSSALMARFSGKMAIGYKTHRRQWLLKTAAPKTPGLHEIQYLWDISKIACQYWFPHLNWSKYPPTKITLPLDPLAIINANQRLIEAHVTEPFWVICPFAHGTGRDGKSKIWPHWRSLSAHLKPHQLIVCPGKNEESLCAKLVPEATVLPGLNLSEYAAVLAQAEYVIANDSGPMHIASAVGASTLAIFGVSDPQRTGPWGNAFIGSQNHWPTLKEVVERIEAAR